MSIIDKISGRAKKTVGDVLDDGGLKRQGAREERKGEAKEQLDNAQDKAARKAEVVANLERKT
jgi:uncharacterized protein YjbJ (UPF0337 family)